MLHEREEREERVVPRRPRLRGLLPEEFWEHHRAARREKLLSWRSFFDTAVERLEEKPAEAEPGRRPVLIPDAFWEHRRAARREDLLACRSLFDAAIEWLEERPPAKVTRIEVE